MIKKPILKLAVLGGALMLTLTAQAETPSAEALAYTCVGCHGANGVSNGPATPSIAGISEDFFTENMEGYASDEIPSTIMGRIARGYTEEEIALLAGYFSQQTFVPAEQTADAAAAEAGAKLHDKYCEKCHAEGGSSSEDDAGILLGQWRPYVHATMNDFISGDREGYKKMMKKVNDMLEKHGDEGLEQLLEYYSAGK